MRLVSREGYQVCRDSSKEDWLGERLGRLISSKEEIREIRKEGEKTQREDLVARRSRVEEALRGSPVFSDIAGRVAHSSLVRRVPIPRWLVIGLGS